MDEDDVRREIQGAIWRLAGWPFHEVRAHRCPKCKTWIYPISGRPDTVVPHPIRKSCVMECKVVDVSQDRSFDVTQIRPRQRRWLHNWSQANGLSFLGLGTINEQPRKIWVIPWDIWIEIENTYGIFQTEKYQVSGSIPIDLEEYIHKGKRDHDLVQDLADYAMVRSSNHWDFGPNHPIRTRLGYTEADVVPLNWEKGIPE